MGAMITRMYTDLGTKRAYAMLTYEHMLPATSFVYMCSLSIGLARCFSQCNGHVSTAAQDQMAACIDSV
jgi:hypothetical protein